MMRALLVWSGALLTVFVALTVLVVVAPDWFVEADQALSQSVRTATADSPVLAQMAQTMTWLGSGWVALGLVLVVGAALLLARRPRLALATAAVIGGSALLNTMVKWSLQRDRPSYPDVVLEPAGSSFPSGHSQSAVATWVTVLLIVGWATVVTGRRARLLTSVVTVTVIAAVGWSRVALGVHWPADVLGGWLLGSAWVLAAGAVLTHWRRGAGTRSARADGTAHADPVDAVRGRATNPVDRPAVGDGPLRRDDSGEPA
jgi:membrane-associated phospholipid phosphatase